MKKSLKILLAAAVVAAAYVAPASARSVIVVAGTADPFLAGGGTDDLNPGSGNLDTTANSAPAFGGSVAGGYTVTWTATGSTGNTPSVSGSDANGGGYISYEATLTGSSFAQPVFGANINSLIGVFTGPNGYADFFQMGTSGSVVVPVGATGFYMGSMDGYQWNNNSGAFDVTLTVVPEPATLISGAMLMLPFGMGAARQLRKKMQRA